MGHHDLLVQIVFCHEPQSHTNSVFDFQGWILDGSSQGVTAMLSLLAAYRNTISQMDELLAEASHTAELLDASAGQRMFDIPPHEQESLVMRDVFPPCRRFLPFLHSYFQASWVVCCFRRMQGLGTQR